jgi:uncharacterized protein YbjT (DUF2867 family)
MNVVLTGATGFVGAEVLAQLLLHPEVGRVTCLTRRALPVSHPKLTAALHADFGSYDEECLARLTDHSACVWALGGKASDFDSPVAYEKVTHGFTIALARLLAARAQRFSFCYLSGMGADPTESAALPWERATRHLKGRTERDLAALGFSHPAFAAYAFRPGGILPIGGSAVVRRLLAPLVVRVDVLAKAMIEVALHGNPRGTISNREIKRIATQAT